MQSGLKYWGIRLTELGNLLYLSANLYKKF